MPVDISKVNYLKQISSTLPDHKKKLKSIKEELQLYWI
jgi:hypothetical protein